jgi:hypothetical protein
MGTNDGNKVTAVCPNKQPMFAVLWEAGSETVILFSMSAAVALIMQSTKECHLICVLQLVTTGHYGTLWVAYPQLQRAREPGHLSFVSSCSDENVIDKVSA